MSSASFVASRISDRQDTLTPHLRQATLTLDGRYAHCRVAILASRIERDSDVFARRRQLLEELVDELRTRTAAVARGGGDKALERHRGRGKLPARERVDRLVDPGTALLEL